MAIGLDMTLKDVYKKFHSKSTSLGPQTAIISYMKKALYEHIMGSIVIAAKYFWDSDIVTECSQKLIPKEL
jgi:hypothetical protein